MKINIISHIGSGGNSGKKVLEKLISYCDKKNISYNVCISEYKGHTIKLVQKLSLKKDKLVIVGGDGTLNEAVNGLKEINSDKPLAYLPAGTGNDFARELGITTDIPKFMEKLIKMDIPEQLEIIKYENCNTNEIGYALNSIGFGIDALIIYLSSIDSNKTLLKKIGLGKLSYLRYVFSAIKKHKNYGVEITSNGKIYKYTDSMLTLITNHSFFGGGIKIDPLSKSNNHEIGIVVTKDIRFIDFLKIIIRIIMYGDHFEKFDKISRISSNNLTLTVDSKQYMQTDGETHIPEKFKINFSLDKHPFWICRK